MRNILTNILRLFSIIQFKDIEHSKYSKVRINPWNPISYLFILAILFFYFLLYGFKGAIEKGIFEKNPFKY